MKSIPSGPTGAEHSFDSGGSAECRVKFINLTLVAESCPSMWLKYKYVTNSKHVSS